MLPDVIGSTIGRMVARRIVGGDGASSRAADARRASADAQAMELESYGIPASIGPEGALTTDMTPARIAETLTAANAGGAGIAFGWDPDITFAGGDVFFQPTTATDGSLGMGINYRSDLASGSSYKSMWVGSQEAGAIRFISAGSGPTYIYDGTQGRIEGLGLSIAYGAPQMIARNQIAANYDFNAFHLRPFDLSRVAASARDTVTLAQIDQMRASPFAAIGFGIARAFGSNPQRTQAAMNLGTASNEALIGIGGMRGVGRPYLGNQVGLTPARTGLISVRDPYANPTIRPSYRKGQVETVWSNAQRNGNVTDPNTGSVLTWDRSAPRAGQWDMGHLPGQEYRALHRRYATGELSLREFLHEYRNPINYRPEDPGSNRSHRYESQ